MSTEVWPTIRSLGDLITVSRYPAFAAAGYVLNSTNGALKGNLNMTGVKTDMNFPINTIGGGGRRGNLCL